MEEVGRTLMACPVGSMARTEDRFVVLRHDPDAKQYVVHYFNPNDCGFYHGSYFPYCEGGSLDKHGALKRGMLEYAERIKTYYELMY